MDINMFIMYYGYVVLVIGSMVEGEIVILLGGVVVYQGLFKFLLVVVVVVLGGMMGDQLFYLLG